MRIPGLLVVFAVAAVHGPAVAATFDFQRSFSPTDLLGLTIVDDFGAEGRSAVREFVLPAFLPASPELLQIRIDGSYALHYATTLNGFVPDNPTIDRNSVRVYGSVSFAVFDEVGPDTGPEALFRSTQTFDLIEACDMNTRPATLPNCQATFDHEATSPFSFVITPPFIDFADFTPLQGLRLEFKAEYSYLCLGFEACDGAFVADWEGTANISYVLVDRPTPVPEPASFAVFGISILGLAAGRSLMGARAVAEQTSLHLHHRHAENGAR